MSKIKILIDSPGDLPLDVAKENDIFVMPVKFYIDNEEELIRDKYDMTEADFYKKIRETGIIPRTVQITPSEFEDYFRQFADDFDDLIVITISSNGSGTFRNAGLAKQVIEEEKDVKIHLIDSKMFSYGYGFGALRASQMAKEGKSAEKIVSEIERQYENTTTFFSVETLDYLKKGGRITTLTAIIGGMLDIRPILKTLPEGLVGAFEKVKGEKKIYPKMVELVKKYIEGCEDPTIFLLFSDKTDKTDRLRELLESNNIKIAGTRQIGSVIGSHAGPGVFGVTIIK